MRVALITGGNKGLGYETARQLKEQGYKVYIGSRDTARGAQAAEALDVTSIQLDVTDEDSIKQAAEAIQAEEGRLDILINNAGISGSMKPPEAITAEVMQQVYDTNVFGIVRMMHHFCPIIRTILTTCCRERQ